MQPNEHSNSAISDGAKAGKKAAVTGYRAGKRAARGIKNAKRTIDNTQKVAKGLARVLSNPYVLGAILVLIILVLVIAGISSPQFQDVFRQAPVGIEVKNPSSDEILSSVYDREYAKKQTEDMMTKIYEVKNNSYRQNVEDDIRNTASLYGADPEESIKHIKYVSPEQIPNSQVEKADLSEEILEKRKEYDEKGIKKTDAEIRKELEKEKGITSTADTGTVIKEFDIEGADYNLQLNNFPYEDDNYEKGKSHWDKSSKQHNIFSSKKVEVDEYGFTRFVNEDGTKDYVCALGSYFGDVGNRYRITFGNGTVATFCKGDAKASQHTVSNSKLFSGNPKDISKYSNKEINEKFNVGAGFSGYQPRVNGRKPHISGILEFIVDQKTFTRKSGSVAKTGLFAGGITKIELIEGTFSDNINVRGSDQDFRILSTFAVSIDNMQITRQENDILGKPVYVNELGEEISSKLIREYTDEALDKEYVEFDFLAEIEDKMVNYNGKFYEVSYTGENGIPEVFEEKYQVEVEKEIEYIANTKKGKKKKKKKITVIEERTVPYIETTVKEVNMEELAKDVFKVNLDAEYIGAINKKVIDRKYENGEVNKTDNELIRMKKRLEEIEQLEKNGAITKPIKEEKKHLIKAIETRTKENNKFEKEFNEEIDKQLAERKKLNKEVKTDGVIVATNREVVESLAINSKNLLYEGEDNVDFGQSVKNAYGGVLYFPIGIDKSKVQISSPFGSRPQVFGEGNFHTGQDFAGVPIGTPIVAAEKGTVVYAQTDPTGSNTIIIQHEGRKAELQTMYAHLNTINVRQGQKVAAGEFIGTLGSTGWSTGPHLHFEVRINRVPHDPNDFLYPNEKYLRMYGGTKGAKGNKQYFKGAFQ